MPNSRLLSSSLQFPLRKIIFDMDDVLWGYTKYVMSQVNIPYEKHIDFNVAKSPLLTPEEKQRFWHAYGDPSFCKNVQFYPGIRGLLQLPRFGAEPWIKSNSRNREIADFKFDCLTTTLPELPAEHIVLNLIDQPTTSASGKVYDEDTFAVIDDSPYNILGSPAKYNIMPMHPWNQSREARAMLAHKNVYYIPAGDISIICALLQSLLLDNAA